MPDVFNIGDGVEPGNNFVSSTGIAGAFGLFSSIQLFNPVGSTVFVRINRLDVFIPTAIAGQSFFSAVPLPNFIKNGDNIITGGPASVAELRYQQTAAPAVVSIITQSATLNIGDSIKPQNSWLIAPGFGMNIRVNSLTNQFVFGNFYYNER